MTALLLLAPVMAIFLLAADPAPESTAASSPGAVASHATASATTPVPAPAQPRVSSPATEAFAAGEAHLAAGRLPMAAYYFEQAARLGPSDDTWQALAYTYYRLDNLGLGDDFAGRTTRTDGRWAEMATRERGHAQERRRAVEALIATADARRRQPSPPAPQAQSPLPAPQAQSPLPAPPDLGESAPPPALGESAPPPATGCALAVWTPGGGGMAASRRLFTAGLPVDCLGSEPGQPPAITVVSYRPEAEAAARQAAAAIGGRVTLRPDPHQGDRIHIRLAQ